MTSRQNRVYIPYDKIDEYDYDDPIFSREQKEGILSKMYKQVMNRSSINEKNDFIKNKCVISSSIKNDEQVQKCKQHIETDFNRCFERNPDVYSIRVCLDTSFENFIRENRKINSSARGGSRRRRRSSRRRRRTSRR